MADKNKRFTSRSKTQEINLGDSYLEPPKRYNKKSVTSTKESKKSSKKTIQTPDIRIHNSGVRDDYGLEAPKNYNSYNTNYQQKKINKTRKKSNVRNRRKKKKAIKFLTFFAVFVLLIILIFIALVFVFPVKEIKISGNEKYSYEDILKESKLSKEDKMFLIDTKKSENYLEKNLPYIRDAEVKRSFPNTVTINITEGVAKFAVEIGKKEFILVDADFKILENDAQGMPAGVIKISSIELKQNKPGEILEFDNKIIDKNIAILANAIIKNQLEKITEIKVKDVNHSILLYDDRINILFGDINESQIDHKINQALASIEKLQETNAAAQGILNLTDDKSIYFTEK